MYFLLVSFIGETAGYTVRDEKLAKQCRMHFKV